MVIGILGKIFLTEVVVFLVSLCLVRVDINSKLFTILGIIILISLISIVVTLLIGIWRM